MCVFASNKRAYYQPSTPTNNPTQKRDYLCLFCFSYDIRRDLTACGGDSACAMVVHAPGGGMVRIFFLGISDHSQGDGNPGIGWVGGVVGEYNVCVDQAGCPEKGGIRFVHHASGEETGKGPSENLLETWLGLASLYPGIKLHRLGHSSRYVDSYSSLQLVLVGRRVKLDVYRAKYWAGGCNCSFQDEQIPGGC